MELPNILFCNCDNVLQWKASINNWQNAKNDLNLEIIIQSLKSISLGFPAEYLNKPCLCVEDVKYRLDVMNEIFLSPKLFSSLLDFSFLLKRLDAEVIEYRNVKHEYQKKIRFISLFRDFYNLLSILNKSLSECESDGLSSLFFYTDIVAKNYCNLIENADKLANEVDRAFNNKQLVVNPKEKTISINKRGSSLGATEHLSNDIQEYFGIKIDYSFSIVDPAPISVLERKVFDALASRNADLLLRLDRFYAENVNLFQCIEDFLGLYSQFEFYLTYVKLLLLSLDGGIPICKPIFCDDGFVANNCACPALVSSFIADKNSLSEIVCNDIYIKKSGMFLLSGPNQGGKTVYLRAIGLTAYLAKCGCLVFCESCSLPFYDYIFTHFMRLEKLGHGRLSEEAERMETIMSSISKHSIVLMNESFSSTRRKDGIEISMYYLHELKKVGCSVGFVSHYYEIFKLFNQKDKCIESLITIVSEGGERTYRVVSSHGKEWAYARDIAIRCGITFEQIVAELERE